MSEKILINLIIRRYDENDHPSSQVANFEVYSNIPYQTLKKDLKALLNINESDEKVIKVRNSKGDLIPYLDILEINDNNEPFLVDVFNVHHIAPTENGNSCIGNAYAYAVQQKVNGIEKRIKQAEILIPQMQMRRQAHTEGRINVLGSRVAFLDRRVDELLPSQWRSQVPLAL